MKDDEEKKHNNEDLEWIYNQVFGEAVEYMKDFDVQAIAATYMAIAMRLYKTHLDEKEYKAMIKRTLTQYEAFVDPNPYDTENVHIFTQEMTKLNLAFVFL